MWVNSIACALREYMRILCFAIDLNTSCYMLEPQYAHLEYHGVSIAYSRLEYIRHFIQWCNMQYARIFCRSGGVEGGEGYSTKVSSDGGIFLSPEGTRENMSDKHNIRAYLFLNHCIRYILFHG